MGEMLFLSKTQPAPWVTTAADTAIWAMQVVSLSSPVFGTDRNLEIFLCRTLREGPGAMVRACDLRDLGG